MELTPRVHSIPANVPFYTGPLAPNVYLVADGGQGALIDAGFPDDASIRARLDYLRSMPGPSTSARGGSAYGGGSGQALRLADIILTHHHFDHSGGAQRLREATGARICLHRQEERLLADWQADAPLDVELPPERREMAEMARAWRQAAAQATPDRLVEDGDTIRVGEATMEVIHTPGHTAGSICLYLREEGVLFAGDTVLGLGTVAVMPPPHGDMGQYIRSLERLKGYPATLLCPGHGPLVRDVGRKLQELIDHRHQREEQVLAAVAGGRGTVRAMLAEIYPELDSRLEGMARGQLLAHLAKLEGEGRVVRQGGEGEEAVWGLG
ncbi:MAG: MBL fold metallo-hydrolase [Chloroflexota bacterium]|nr:MBL fold metallo-hydrolase [Chloroflexota bacterium]